MKILIIHQVPYRKIDYAACLDHDAHEVAYAGFPARMADLPSDLRCRRIVLDEGTDLADGVISRVSAEDGFEKVLSLSEFGILEAWYVRQHLDLPGPSLAGLEKVRDKLSMKQAAAAAGVAHPRFCEPVPEAVPEWSGRTVLKPRRGATSEGISVYPDPASAYAAYRALGSPAGYELEEFVEGDLYHADALVVGGVVRELVPSRTVNRWLEFITGTPVGSYQVPDDTRHRPFAQQVVEALDIAEGCIHLEYFDAPDRGLVFLEIANRVGGGGIITAHLRHTGIHLPAHEIAVRLGLERPRALPPTGRFHGWLVFPGHDLPADRPHRVEVPQRILQDPRLDRLHTLPPGAPPPDHVTYQEWLVPAFVEASATEPELLAEFLEDCARSITVHSVPASEESRHAVLSH